jgi:hypothetical protein
VANRKITQFEPIQGNEIEDPDVLTLVHVNEVNPELKNKKITFTQFKLYLDEYYERVDQSTTHSGSVTIQGDLTVSGTSFLNQVTATGDVTLTSGTTLQVSGQAEFTRPANQPGFAIGFTTMTGTLANIDEINSQDIRSSSVSGVIVKGPTVSGATVTGNTGNFANLNAGTITVTTITGSNIVTENLSVTGTATIHDASVLTLTGEYISGVTVVATTGTMGQLTVGGTSFLVGTVTFNTMSGSTVIAGTVSGMDVISTRSGIFNNINATGLTTVTTLTGQQINAVSGQFEHLNIGSGESGNLATKRYANEAAEIAAIALG